MTLMVCTLTSNLNLKGDGNTKDWDNMFGYVLENKKTIPDDSHITYSEKEKIFRLWIKEV